MPFGRPAPHLSQITSHLSLLWWFKNVITLASLPAITMTTVPLTGVVTFSQVNLLALISPCWKSVGHHDLSENYWLGTGMASKSCRWISWFCTLGT